MKALSTSQLNMKQIEEENRMISRRTREKLRRWGARNFWDVVRYTGSDFNNEIKVGNKDSNFNGIEGLWKDQIVIAIGNSFELNKIDLNLLNGLNTIGCNHLIDKWNGMKIFVVQDNRFFQFSSYDFQNYTGLIFAHNRITKIDYNFHPNLYFFISAREPKLKIMEGMYSRKQTGTVCVNLALITGAKKVYLLGLDRNKNDGYSQHHFDNYNGIEEDKQKEIEGTKKANDKMIDLMRGFIDYKDKIINVCDNGYLDYFNSISPEEFMNRIKEGRL